MMSNPNQPVRVEMEFNVQDPLVMHFPEITQHFSGGWQKAASIKYAVNVCWDENKETYDATDDLEFQAGGSPYSWKDHHLRRPENSLLGVFRWVILFMKDVFYVDDASKFDREISSPDILSCNVNVLVGDSIREFVITINRELDCIYNSQWMEPEKEKQWSSGKRYRYAHLAFYESLDNLLHVLFE